MEAKLAKKKIITSDEEEKRKLVEKLLWNASVSNRELANVKFKAPYSSIQKTTQMGDFSTMLRIIDEVLTFI